jgi:hypothetical protein
LLEILVLAGSWKRRRAVVKLRVVVAERKDERRGVVVKVRAFIVGGKYVVE